MVAKGRMVLSDTRSFKFSLIVEFTLQARGESWFVFACGELISVVG